MRLKKTSVHLRGAPYVSHTFALEIGRIFSGFERMANDVIDSHECAELLRCTPYQIEELARTGEIPGTQAGRSWIFVRTDLLEFLAQKARKEAEERRTKRQVKSVHLTSTIVKRSRARVAPTLPVLHS